jgi:hypothetical protein
MGSELPNPNLVSIGNIKMYVKISVGMHEKSTTAKENIEGVCTFGELIDFDPISFPIEEDQIPDIFIHLYKEKATGPLCYQRLKAKDVLDKGFSAPAEWIFLNEDKDNDQLSDRVFPGQILLKLGKLYIDLYHDVRSSNKK